MITEGRVIAASKAALACLFALLVLLQVMSLPGQFAHMARESPDAAYLRWPLTAVSIFWVVCIQVVVVSTWKLLTLVRRDRIFTDASFVWVDAIVRSIAAAGAVLAVVFLVVGFTADDPGLPLLLFLFCMIIGVAALLMVVMRALLRQATPLRTDMDAVI
ncbi:hypothetical protein ASG56_12565 [Rhodococcus sp. Leaf7]|uniref:DUF2975 domain-containing protein n=1 Tax=unclassified Rhodococcus (in: high G+C Gram-positive bacteria) TaxID=192944 RepID=UPI0006F67761|nr:MULTISPECIES: DUF2975 domain-containing protein [unclassified Rhodococcus (in: high G+C Gram-positive bacteria)]KQU04219.1 hypothetical protein ASG56_12565 [Rhodococcus sp. Leaf7]KQU40404.1 hypothetical protein ASG64_12560 [Rhodococcus sp. Leaf247]